MKIDLIHLRYKEKKKTASTQSDRRAFSTSSDNVSCHCHAMMPLCTPDPRVFTICLITV